MIGEHDRRLVGHVHPPDWMNPVPADRYHLVVVGAGTAGLVSAAIAAGLGARVALVERHLMGGDCLNVGCVPSKAVIRAARAWHDARSAAERFGGPRVVDGDGDFAAAMERMRALRADISPVDGAARFRDLGVDVFLGKGRFVAADEVAVDAGMEPVRLRFRKAIIATGGRAATPSVDGLEDVPFLTNETVFDLTEPPRRLGVLGGGPVGCELAQAFARLGSRVQLFDRNVGLLHREDPEASRLVERAMVRDGVEVHSGASLLRVAQERSGIAIDFERGGEKHRAVVDRLLLAAGRAPNVEGLGLEAAGVAYDASGVDVDARMRTSNRKIYAIGDVASEQKFTHLADFQARMVIRNALFFGRGRSADLVVPRCTYTSPEIAHVGLDAGAAAVSGREVEELTVSMEEVDRARLDDASEGFLKLLLEPGTDRILGATLVAEHAGDLVGPLCLAVSHDIGLEKFSQTMFPYPTQAEIFRKAGDQFSRRKLTPTVRTLFEGWFRLFR